MRIVENERHNNHRYISEKRQYENGPWKQIIRKNNYSLNKGSLRNFKRQVFWKINLLNVEPQQLAEEKEI